ncbi:hypothetical protein D9A36_24830 [Vibrio parahaemolyticus]|nr:hypothetical protein [Vibrio parahaemolyticus]EGR1384223.1 hypothetical protein [Vibrio parahaemolyticus]
MIVFQLSKDFSNSVIFNFPKAHNAALRGEQRRPPNLNHCAVITEAESNPKCRALGIPLERFVM